MKNKITISSVCLVSSILLTLSFIERKKLANTNRSLQSTTQMDEFRSRVLLASITKQAGLSHFEIPELQKILYPSANIPLEFIMYQRESILLSIPTIAPAAGWISSGFGERSDPFKSKKSEHKGIDISNDVGTPIVAPADGVVRFTGKYGRFGNYVSLVHGYGIVTKYAHLNDIRVKAGQSVKKGDVIATMGNSGHSTGTHLHWEVWVNDKPANPYAFMNEGPNRGLFRTGQENLVAHK